MVSRTPGHDIELIHGYLLGEGFIGGREDVRGARYCEGSVLSQDTGFSQNSYNVISVTTENPVIRLQGPVSRECGQPSVDALDIIPPVRIAEDPTIVTAASIRAIAAELVRRSGISPYTAASLLARTATTRDDARQLLAVDKVRLGRCCWITPVGRRDHVYGGWGGCLSSLRLRPGWRTSNT